MAMKLLGKTALISKAPTASLPPPPLRKLLAGATQLLNSLAPSWGAPTHEGLASFLIREPHGRDHEPVLLLT